MRKLLAGSLPVVTLAFASLTAAFTEVSGASPAARVSIPAEVAEPAEADSGLAPPGPVAYCFGDGSGAPCPCSPAPVPHGVAGRGCPNSVFPGGALLTASGTPSIASDTLVMTATDVVNGGCIVFQGTNDNGGGTAFGDGRRCAAGSVFRMKPHPTVGNTHTYPDPMFSDIEISVRGGVLDVGDRYYQAWYRNNHPTFCDPAGLYNLTNGVRVTWVP